MDGYIVGFVGVMFFLALASLATLIFASLDSAPSQRDTRVLYTTVRHLDTNHIETVDAAGRRQIWQKTDTPA